MMAGIDAVASKTSQSIFQTRETLALRIASHEAERIRKISSGKLPETLATHLAACVTLQGGCSFEDAKRLIAEERAALDATPAVPMDDIIALLADLLPEPRGFAGVDAIRPDLIGEAFVVVEIARPKRSPDAQWAIVERALRRSEKGVRRLIGFVVDDFSRGEPSHPTRQWMGRLVTVSTEEFRKKAVLGALSPDEAAEEITRIGVTAQQWKTLTEILAPFADKLSRERLGLFASRRAVSFVETSDYAGGIKFIEATLKRSNLPDFWRPELFNALGRCHFHLKSYVAAADAYRKGIEAAAADAYRKGIEASSSDTSLLSQLWVNFGYALMGSGPNPVRNIPAAVEAMREGIKLAGDRRMEVDARVGLSTALLNSDATNPKRFEDAEVILNQAWSLAQSDRLWWRAHRRSAPACWRAPPRSA